VIILIFTIFAFIINLFFGVLRADTRIFSLKWFLYIHIPVFILIPVRLNIELSNWYIPYFIVISFSGQYLGVLWGRHKKGVTV
jgi:hypothetical protein